MQLLLLFNMKCTIKKLLIISGIIPATFLAYLSILGVFLILPDIFSEWDWFKFLFSISCFFGLGGYVALWSSLSKSSDKKIIVLRLILLGGGLVSLLFILYHKQSFALRLSTNLEDIGRLILFLWPAIISLILIIKALKEIKDEFSEKI